jgi:hypothetical protein
MIFIFVQVYHIFIYLYNQFQGDEVNKNWNIFESEVKHHKPETIKL